ncbi:chromosome partitioning protein, ParB family [Streptomyces misionensis]|uniref:Chromosome partitioning protein, ParB family n=1 Tax=Streptomyces misionensis TaxID=67331 RepID=A0A1H4IDJ0_9ACTN|nr:ParB/RepB/Spo0J family partition protein [Streptomyces misionensis]SEB32003.1 chromosome partitioning protein, ParB family [Streptomyces misionensis]
MAGKRVSLASLAASKVEAVPGASRPELIHVHPDLVAPTPLNPRRAFDEAELVELGEDMRNGQLQPCVAVNKTAYLKLYPEHADQLPDTCRYVMAAGERRWRAARQVGLGNLDLMLRHDLTETRVRFLAAVLSENVQRANFNPIEEADGLRAMLELHDGNQAAAARAMGKSKAWFNQRIGLLRLSDEMVQLVLQGELTAFREMRRYAAMPRDEQYAAWKADQEQPRPSKPEPGSPAREPIESSEMYTAVYTPNTPASASQPAADSPPAPDERTGSAPVSAQSDTKLEAAPPKQTSTVPAQAAESAGRQPATFPYHDAVFAAQLLVREMPQDQLDLLTDLLAEQRSRKTAETV